MTICVFASSSSRIDPIYGETARHLGSLLAREGIGVVFGGGGIGLMGKLADSVIENGGSIIGVIPGFMKDEGWDHEHVTEMIITPDMGERKKKMFELSDGILALPGGVGTLEELTEAITLKQLSLFHGPIVVLNTRGYYDSLISFFDNMVHEHFLRMEHKAIWEIAGTPEEAISAIKNWSSSKEDWRRIAKI